MLVHSLASCATFLVHRLSHRLTNAAALLLLPAFRASSAASSSAASSGAGAGAAAAAEAILRSNPWWLCPDPAVASFATGYQWLVLALFAVAFPLTVAARAWAAAATAFLCLRADEEEEEEEEDAGGGERGDGGGGGGEGASSPSSSPPSPSPSSFKLPPLFPPVRKTLAALRAASPRAAEAFPRAWAAELLVAARAVPLQALSLLLLPLPWTLPRLLDLQVAPVVAAVEGGKGGKGGKGAIERAAELTSGGNGGGGGGGGKGQAATENKKSPPPPPPPPSSSSFSLPFLLRPSRRRAALAWPFLLLLVAPRVLAAVKEASLAALTPRVAAALPEVPLLLAAAGAVGGVVLARMSDVLPFVAWRWFVREEERERREREEKREAEGGGGEGEEGVRGERERAT